MKTVKGYTPKLTEHLLLLRDTLNRFDQHLGEFIMVLKQNCPKQTEHIRSQKEYQTCVAAIKEKKKKTRRDINTRILDEYPKVAKCILDTAEEIADNVLHPLLQVHAQCETDSQRELKAKLRQAIKETRAKLQPDFELSAVRHVEWQGKILLAEQRLCAGLLCLLPTCVDSLLDADAYLDEYLSGVNVSLRK